MGDKRKFFPDEEPSNGTKTEAELIGTDIASEQLPDFYYLKMPDSDAIKIELDSVSINLRT